MNSILVEPWMMHESTRMTRRHASLQASWNEPTWPEMKLRLRIWQHRATIGYVVAFLALGARCCRGGPSHNREV
jgi:hypothetical protein